MEWLVLVWAVLCGFAIASFTCVVIDRLPVALDEPNDYGEIWDTRPWKDVLGGTSRCSSCGAGVRARDNIPVLGWLMLRGRCRDCGERIPAFHPLVELAVPAIGVALWLGIGTDWRLLPALLLVPTGVAIAVIDFRTLIVPTRLVWPTMALEVVASVVVVLVAPGGTPRWFLGAAIGIGVMAVPLFALWWINPRGMGFGDVRLCTLLGWTIGFSAAAAGAPLPVVAIVSTMTMALAAILGIALALVTMRSRGRHVPFGPALVTASFLVLGFMAPFVEPFLPA